MFIQLKVTGCLKTLDQSKNYESKLKSVKGTTKLRNENETKRNETKYNETKRKMKKRNETK